MKSEFVRTSSVERFLVAAGSLEERAAREAGFMLAYGEPGYGKSRTALWWSTQKGAVLLRLQAGVTSSWLMSDLVRELGEPAPARGLKELVRQAFSILMRDPRPIVIDEVEHAMTGRLEALETLRGITDFLEIPLVMSGREACLSKLRRHPQFWTRIHAMAHFGPATLADVRLLADGRCQSAIGDDVLARIHKESEGRVRLIVEALHRVEKIGRRNRGAVVTLAEVGDMPLTPDWLRTRPKVA